MDKVPDAPFQAFTDTIQTPSSSRHSTASNYFGEPSGLTLLCNDSIIGTVLKAPEVTFPRKKRPGSEVSCASVDSGYYSDTKPLFDEKVWESNSSFDPGYVSDMKTLFDEEAREGFTVNQENQHSAGFGMKIDIDAEEAGHFKLPAALLSQYPAIQNLDWSQTQSGEEQEEVYSLDCFSLDSGYESKYLVYPSTPTPPLLIQAKADVGGLKSSLQRLCSNSPDELCKSETKNSSADVEQACGHLSSSKPISDPSTWLHEDGECETSPTHHSRVASTTHEVSGASAGTEVFDYFNMIDMAHAERRLEKRQSIHLDDITKLIENPKTDDRDITEDAAESNADFHDSSVSIIVAGALSRSLSPSVDLVLGSYQDPRNVPEISCAALARADCDPKSLPTGQYADGELRDDSVSSPGEDYQTEVTSVQADASQSEEDGKFQDEEAWPLSPNECSPNSDSENGYESTSERSILNYSQKNLITRLMDEICSSFFFQTCHRPRQHGRNAVDSFSSESTKSSITTIDFKTNDSSASRGKRARRVDEDPEDEEDGQHKRRRSKESVSSGNPLAEVRYFACPFQKFDVSTYSNRNENPRLALKYRSCGPPGWPTIGKMK